MSFSRTKTKFFKTLNNLVTYHNIIPVENVCQMNPTNTFMYTWNAVQLQFRLEKVAETLLDP